MQNHNNSQIWFHNNKHRELSNQSLFNNVIPERDGYNWISCPHCFVCLSWLYAIIFSTQYLFILIMSFKKFSNAVIIDSSSSSYSTPLWLSCFHGKKMFFRLEQKWNGGRIGVFFMVFRVHMITWWRVFWNRFKKGCQINSVGNPHMTLSPKQLWSVILAQNQTISNHLGWLEISSCRWSSEQNSR